MPPVSLPVIDQPCTIPDTECGAPANVPDETWNRVRTVAAYRLWRATGSRFGECARQADVCSTAHSCCTRTAAHQHGQCSCRMPRFAIALPQDATSVDAITDPATGDPLEGWTVLWSHQQIVRATRWPHLVEVDYQTGTPWPMDAAPVIDQYAASLAKDWCNNEGTDCDLPTGVKVMSRDGVEYMVEADRDDMTIGDTGLTPVDDWLHNQGAGYRPSIWTQDRSEQLSMVEVTS